MSSRKISIKTMTPLSYILLLSFSILIFSFFISAPSVHAFTIGVPSNLLTLNSGLVGYWTFDGKDVVNGVARDKSGNANHGSLVNIATSTFYAPGKIGQGFNFDGSNDYVSVGNNTVLAPTTAVTISAWVKPLRKVDSSHYSAITSRGSINYLFMVRQGGIVLFYLPGVQNWVTGDGAKDLFDGQWHHALVTYDGSFQRLYIDTTLISSSAITGNITSNSNATLLGRDTTGASNYNFNGLMDDVRIYNRALSPQEISQLYSMGAATKIASSGTASSSPLMNGLVGYWTFDGKDVINGVARDMSGNANHGNLINIATSTFYAPGKIGQGFNFDGVDDYVKVPDNSNLDFGANQDFSYDFWIKSNKPTLHAFVSKRAGSGAGHAFYIGGGTTHTLGFFDSSNVFYGFNANLSLSLTNNVWTHIAVIFDRDANLTVYKNGSSLNATSIASGSSVDISNSTALQIGEYTGAGRPLGGTMDNFRLYNRALSAQEVGQLYKMGR